MGTICQTPVNTEPNKEKSQIYEFGRNHFHWTALGKFFVLTKIYM